MGGIFINYRRHDSEYIAGRLRNDLARRFGADFLIFRDVDSLPLGPFPEEIDQAVRSCDVMVVVIGDGWLDARDAEGGRRLEQPGDWVRQEIGSALRQTKILVPVLVEGARLPSADELPHDIRELVVQQAVELPDSRWDYEVGRLVEKLEKSLRLREPLLSGDRSDVPAAPPPPSTPRPRPKWALGIIPVVVLAVGVALVLISGHSGPKCSPGRTPSTGNQRAIPPSTTDGSYEGPWSVKCRELTLAIERIETARSSMRVQVLVNNETGDTLALPASRFNLVDNTGHSYQTNPFSENWPDEIPPGVLRGVIEVVEQLRPEVITMKAGWGTVFGTFKVDKIFVEDIRLR